MQREQRFVSIVRPLWSLPLVESTLLGLIIQFWDQDRLTGDTLAIKAAECLEAQRSKVTIFVKDKYSLLGPG